MLCSDPFVWKEEELLKDVLLCPLEMLPFGNRTSIAQSINRAKDFCAQGL